MEDSDTRGHRQRIKQRFRQQGLKEFSDYEALELMLTYAIARKDVKQLSKDLLKRFGSFQRVLEAQPEELMAVGGMGEHAAVLLSLFRHCAEYYLRAGVVTRDVISSPHALVAYCKAAMAHLGDEQFRVVYLNAKNEVIRDDVLQEGTIDQTAVYPRKIIEHALKLKAAALILVHNHPSGNPEPSAHDRQLTKNIVDAAATMDIRVHDHIIIGRSGYYSLREEGLLQ